ncbi:MAG: hypothetical protein M3011_09390, partial [Actinomycetota bacterium]|nr:hypothetical protein [Actinomycetota bacterium]
MPQPEPAGPTRGRSTVSPSTSAPTGVSGNGGAIEYVYWATGTAHLLLRLLRGQVAGPVLLSQRRPGPARRPAIKDVCPGT